MGPLFAKLVSAHAGLEDDNLPIPGTRTGGRLRRPVAVGIAFVCMIVAAVSQPTGGTDEAERAKNEDAVLTMWPEAADPQSIMGREIQRLLDEYTAKKDPRLQSVTAPMWIASQAAANTERLRTDADSQQSAMRLHPGLAVLDSPLNQLFRETYARYKEVKPEYFDDPRWPLKLAQQCALQLDAQKAAGSLNGQTSRPGKGGGGSPAANGAGAESPARRWILTSLLILAGAVLVALIIRYALKARRRTTGEEDDSSTSP